MQNPFRKFFIEEVSPEESLLTDCHEVVAFANEPYFEKFMAFLERGADEPLAIGDQISMIRSASRVNTFKEIKTYLKKQISSSVALIDRESRNE